VLVRALLLTLLVLAGLGAGLGWLASLLPGWSFSLPWIGTISLDGFSTVLTVVLIVAASAFLMLPVAAIFIGFFLDRVASAVEARHYPGLPPVRAQGLGEALGDALRFLLVLVAANLLALAFYLFAGPFAPVVFWLVNGYLLGREYFQLVALRRLPPAEASGLRRANRFRIWAAGTVMVIPLSVPVLGLLVPILGVATFTHLFHRLAGQPQRG
jgi:uncharacterized protein involved in cysteine biosynthesis